MVAKHVEIELQGQCIRGNDNEQSTENVEQEIDYDFVNHENIIQIEDQATEKQYLFESSTPIEIVNVDLSDLKKKENSDDEENMKIDQDNTLEAVKPNDSYLDCIVDNVILDESKVLTMIPAHDQTITNLISDHKSFDEAWSSAKEIDMPAIQNAPVLIKPIIEFMFSEKLDSKYDPKEETKGYDHESIIGLDLLLNIKKDIDNLLYNQDQILIYCKFIDFNWQAHDQETQFLQNLVYNSINTDDAYNYASGSICNLIAFSSIRCEYEYIRDLLIDPENE